MRWTRLHTATVILLALAFVGVTIVKHGPGWTSAAETDTTAVQRTGEQTFWQRYRRATQQRTAGQMDSAAATYRTALDRRPTHQDALYYLGHVLYSKNELHAARDTWRTLLDTNPKSARAHTQIGEVHFCFPEHDLFDLDRAETAYQKALALHNEETRPLLRRGTIALLRQDRSAARTHLEAVRGSNRNNPDAAFLVGYLAWQNDESARATVLLRKAQNRYEAQNSAQTPSCPLAETMTITAPVEREDSDSSAEKSPYARVDSVLQRIRTEYVQGTGS